MKLGFMEALRRTQQTGEAPVPEPRPTREEPMTSLHDQLLASLQERTASAASPVLVPYITPGPLEGISRPAGPPARTPVQPLAPKRFAPGEDRELSLGARARRGRDARGKGTIEEVLGDAGTEAAHRPVDHAVPDPGTARVGGADPARGVAPPLPDPRAEEPDDRPDPPARAAGRACPICEGKGTLAIGNRQVPCGRCGGEGYVEDPQVHDRHRAPEQVIASHIDAIDAQEAAEDAANAALAREAAGVQVLPLESLESPPHAATDEEVYQLVESFDETPEGPIRFPGSIAESNQGPDPRYRPWMDRCLALAAADAEGPTEAQAVVAPSLTYDLPSLDALPPFCFICGPAGTGKTFQAKAWAAADPEGVVLAATTGIAAVNLGEGTTINALMRFYDTASLAEAFTGGWLESQLKRQRAAGLRRLVIDETSMLSGDQLTILTRAIDNVNQDRKADDADLGLVLVGDFAQLPPVREPFAFESQEWDRYAQATYGLTTIRRQADRPFIEALQAVRRGDAAAALDFFGPRLEQTTHPQFDGTTVFAKNDAVDRYNGLRLDKVTGAAVTFGSQRWGKLRSEWGGPPKPVHTWDIPETLSLKVGALVMILANRNIAEPGAPPEYLYVNGDLGTLVEAEKGTATVVLQRTGEPVEVVPIVRENLIPLEVGRRKALKEAGHPERVSASGKHEVIGAVSYVPLRLAWGTTVHKSQGLSLDAVQVNIRDHFFCSPSMLYVALSRARTAEGLRIVGTPEGFKARCTVHPKVKDWL